MKTYKKAFILNSNDIKSSLSPLFYENIKKFPNINFKKLKDVAILNPNRYKGTYIDDDLVDYVGLPETSNIQINTILKRKYLEVKGRKVIQNNDILFARIEPSIYNKKYILANGLKNITFTSTEFYIIQVKENILNKFLFYMLFEDIIFNQIKGKITGSTGRRRLDRNVFENLLIPIPPKNIQNKIISIMDNAYKIKKENEQKVKKLLNSIDKYLLDELDITLPKEKKIVSFEVDSSDVFRNRFDPNYHKKYYKELENSLNNGKYKVLKLKKILIFLESGSRPKGGVSNIENGVLSLGAEHIKQDLEINTLNKPKYISEKFNASLEKTKLRLNDILIVKDGATTGKIGIIINTRELNQNINEHLFLLRFNNEINNYFIVNILNSKFINIFLKKEITGATVTGLNKEALKSIKIPLPPLDIQNKIASHIQSIRDEAKSLQREAKEVLENGKKEVEDIILGNSK